MAKRALAQRALADAGEGDLLAVSIKQPKVRTSPQISCLARLAWLLLCCASKGTSWGRRGSRLLARRPSAWRHALGPVRGVVGQAPAPLRMLRHRT